MPGQGRFDGGFGRLPVPGLTHQQDIGVLPHEGPQGHGEVVALLPVDLGLGNALEGVFDRVLNRGDVDPRVVAFRQEGIERGALA